MSENLNPSTAPDNLSVSVCGGFTNHVGDMTLLKLYEVIKSDKLKDKISKIRWLNFTGNQAEAELLKAELLGFTVSCRFKSRRTTANVVAYSGFVVLDIDDIAIGEIQRLKELLKKCSYVVCFFVSPSGNGLKIIVQTDGLQHHHKYNYNAVADYFQQLLGVQIDRSGSDIVRLCFMSWDEDAYFNTCNQVFVIPAFPSPSPKHKRPLRPSLPLPVYASPNRLFNKAVGLTMRKRDFVEGNGTARSGRNSFVFLLSCYCRFFGLSEDDALGQILQFYNYDKREIERSVRSAFKYK